jgi:hypothetical protein
MSYQFKAFDPTTGLATAFLPQIQECQISVEFSDAGSLSFQYNKKGINYSALTANRVEIGVFLDGVEMDDCRFTVLTEQSDDLQDGESVKFTGLSLLARLKKAIVYSGDGSLTQGLDQQFVTSTPGGILKALFDQNYARGAGRVMRDITYASFSNTLDSNGNAWAFTFGSITYRVGTNYLDVIRNMVSNGMIEVKMVGRDLRVYNAGGLGTDRTIVANPVVLRRGRELSEAPRTRTREGIAAVGLIGGDNGVIKVVTDTSVGAAWGYDEVFISQGGISDDTTLGVVAANSLASASQIRVENTYRVIAEASPWIPYTDYRVSDYIWGDTTGAIERLRIRQMVMDITPVGVSTVNLVLNDKFLELDIVNSRRIDGILGGASADGSVAIPAEPFPVDNTTPKDPASLTPSGSVYVNEAGRSLVSVGLTWPAVTQNTDLSTLTDLGSYQTEYRIDSTTAVIAPLSFTPSRDDEVMTRKFDRRGRGYGWLGADGGASARATSGKDFWLFADTNLGIADGDGKITSQWSFIHNSVVLTDPAVPTTFDAKWGMGNALTKEDSWLDTTIGNWQADTNCAVARDTGVFYYGTASLKITATAAADAVARIAAPATSNYPVTVGQTYSAQAKVKTLSGTARNVILSIRWYNASNALVSTTTGSSVAGSTTVWTRHNVSGVAPATATKATILVTIVGAAAAQIFNVDQIGLHSGDCSFGSWCDPNRGTTGPVALVNPEDAGGTAISVGSLPNALFWTDDVKSVSGKIYGFMGRYSPAGVFQSTTSIAVWNGTTHAFEGLTLFSTSDVMSWGTQIFQSGGFLYVFGAKTDDSPATLGTYLMRVPDSNILSGLKEYATSTSNTWSTTRASAVAVYTGFQTHPGGMMLVGATYNSMITVYGEGTMRRLTSSNIWGPFTDAGSFYTQPSMGSGAIAYFARIHPQLSDNSGLLMSYSVNGTVGGKTSLDDIRLYAPKFLRGAPSSQPSINPATGWSAPRVIESSVISDAIGDIPPGWNFQARVRAVDVNGNASIWRTSASIRTTDDTTPPNKPSTPIIGPAFRGLRIEWDGMDYQGGPAPADWDRMEVHMSEIDNFQPGPLTLVDTFTTRLGGVSPIQGLEYGHTYYARFVAIDVRGNRSVPSDDASSGLEQLVDAAEIGRKLITGAMVADSTLTVKSITVAAFDPSIVPNGGFEDEATDAAGVGTGLPAYWQSSGWFIGGGATPSYETSAPLAGNKSFKLTMATAADGLRYASAKFPVTAGRLLAASVKVKASRAIANPAFEIHIVCGNTEANTGAFPSAGVSIWGSSATVTGTTSIQKLELQRIVDPLMTYAQVFITALNANDGGGGWVATFDEVNCLPVGGSAYIADASILNAKIANLAVDNAKIADMSVGKLTAGTLAADMTVSARIKTANTGARVELNSSGLQAFNSGGGQTVNIASSTGNVTLVGAFKTDFATSTTPHLEMENSGDRTTIFFTDNSGAGTNFAFMNSPLDGSNVPRIGINSGEFTYLSVANCRSRLFLSTTTGIQLQTITSSLQAHGYGLDMRDSSMSMKRHVSGVVNGFGLNMATSSMTLERLTSGLVDGAQYFGSDTSFTIRRFNSSSVMDGGQIYSDSSRLILESQITGTVGGQLTLWGTGSIEIMGAFKKSNTMSGKSALFTDVWTGVNASSGATVTYGVTMGTIPVPMYSIESGSDQGADRMPVARSATSFTIQHINSVTVSLHYWAFRIF